MNYKLATLIAESEASDAEIIEFIKEIKDDPIASATGMCFLKDDWEIFHFIIEVNFELGACILLIPEIKDLELLDEIATVTKREHLEIAEIAMETKSWRNNLRKSWKREEERKVEKEGEREKVKEKVCA